MVRHRGITFLALSMTLTLFVASRLPESHAVCNPIPCNTIVNPGFEDNSSTVWHSQDKTYGNGTVKIYDSSHHHSGSYSAVLNATKTKLTCPTSSECKDSVRATVEQYLSLSPGTPALDSLSTSNDSFSSWWWVAGPAMSGMPSYSIHIGIVFADTSNNLYSLEYWYGTSDLSNQQYNLGPIPMTNGWFQMARNLTRDVQSLNILDKASTRVQNVWFSAFGNITMGEIAWLDDASVKFVPHPIPFFSANPAVGPVPLTVSFDGTGTVETAGGPGITNYKWSFGDETPETSGVNSRVVHTYNSPGNFTAVLTVTDVNGQSRSISSRIVINAVRGNGEGGLLVPAVAGAFGTVLVGGLLFLRGRSHGRKAKNQKRKR